MSKSGCWSLLLLAVSLFGLNSCEKDTGNTNPLPKVGEVPVIVFLGINSSTIKQFSDSLVFYISFTDGDGDIGFANADSLSLKITDNRFPVTHQYHVQPFSPQGTTQAIQGTIEVSLKNIILKNPANAQETATFTIKLRDRTNNWSNEVTSQQVVITQ